ncbi:MAG: LOG family protein [Actinomycetota bacterium]|nr:LOG family protein [Actinomycetota bacterium]
MPVVAVFGSSAAHPGDWDYQEGRRLGRRLAQAGFSVATGGYGGLMEAVSEGAGEAGGQVIGVTVPTVFPDRSGANPHITEERRAASLAERIHELTDVAAAAVALPGSIGTLTELMVAWNLAYVAPFSRQSPKPVVAVGELWGELVPLLRERLQTDGLVVCVASAEEAVEVLRERLLEETS